MNEKVRENVEHLLRDILAPLVRADGGQMHLVRWEGDDLYLHLSGACAGCPGASLTSDDVILPAVHSLVPNVRLVLTTGVRIPDGARKL
ncbi:MAG: NifU family protein [Polyangiaceae bacterium]